ncbi:hypothetical protein EJ08DRAFT_658889 [Tothia fuscella]|uniref:CheW-like domain-containing protein n=1 Tax=Tothia fuscella TaxID=1048955 RepID=A0A9P4NWE6_9PEZI|nr:hypothetical protein EJ08DRAFT_658889 [Tothia fuscella]
MSQLGLIKGWQSWRHFPWALSAESRSPHLVLLIEYVSNPRARLFEVTPSPADVQFNIRIPMSVMSWVDGSHLAVAETSVGEVGFVFGVVVVDGFERVDVVLRDVILGDEIPNAATRWEGQKCVNAGDMEEEQQLCLVLHVEDALSQVPGIAGDERKFEVNGDQMFLCKLIGADDWPGHSKNRTDVGKHTGSGWE